MPHFALSSLAIAAAVMCLTQSIQDSANLTPDQAAGSTPASSMNEEDMQAVRQWLNRIPESQSALLKEKFLREYRRRPKRRYGGDPW